jgi:FkbM family methyltransferase
MRLSSVKSLLKVALISIFSKFGFTLSKNSKINLETRIHSSFIERSGGVLHIGAHKGQEANWYDKHSASVLWIEAIPEVYNILIQQIASFENQKAMLALLGDINQESVPFHISSNDAVSSSIYEFGSELGFVGLSMTKTLYLPMVRLDSILSVTDAAIYPHWVLDVQGSEMNVLKGSGALLDQCLSIYIEVSTREVYKGGVLFQELKEFLTYKGFIPLWNPLNLSHENVIFAKVANVRNYQ